MQRRSAGGAERVPGVPAIVNDVLSQDTGVGLPDPTRTVMESRLGQDFSRVRVHTGPRAAATAQAVNALAYTVGRDVVFGDAQYSPQTQTGQRLLAHELTHVMQQNAGTGINTASAIGEPDNALEREADAVAAAVVGGDTVLSQSVIAPVSPIPGIVQRTPAGQVGCGNQDTLHVPDAPPFDVDDPVGVITAAEDGANALLDGAIDEIDSTRQQILAGSPVGFPTVSDNLGFALSLLALDANSEHFWKATGLNTAALLLRRLRLIRGTIGVGSFFFTCLGPPTGTIGKCTGSICTNAEAASCGGSFRIVFCVPFWGESAEDQAATVLHESAHNFADFIQDTGREGNAECYARLCETIAGVDPASQRTDLCPDP